MSEGALMILLAVFATVSTGLVLFWMLRDFDIFPPRKNNPGE